METEAVCFCRLNPVCEIEVRPLLAQNGQKASKAKSFLNLMYVLRKTLETLISSG